jgi:hypothetical protein
VPRTYKPTGNPPGRPPKIRFNGAVQKMADLRQKIRSTTGFNQPYGEICPVCFPEGWERWAKTAGCQHGVWRKRGQ